jgi:SAM-dependent methyltransferase
MSEQHAFLAAAFPTATPASESTGEPARYPLPMEQRSPAIQAVAAFLQQALPRGERSVGKRSLLGVGGGATVWLPYLAQELGYRAFGLEPKRSALRSASLRGERTGVHIIEGDLCDPVLFRSVKFDVVLSSGLVAEASTTFAMLKRMAGLLKPGGIMVTVVPNLAGLPGLLQSCIDRRAFGRQVVLSASDLEQRHRALGLRTMLGPAYLGGFDLGSLNWQSLLEGRGALVHRLFGGTVALVNASTNLGLQACGWSRAWWAAPVLVIASQKGRA